VADAATLSDFRKKTGFEEHSIELNYDGIFENVPLPNPALRGYVYPGTDLDFRLRSSSAAIDAGSILPNVTDNFKGKAPDLGAIEYGEKQLKYGPR
jgi:hypothetical protein